MVVTGHSAGAHAALWVAARHRLPATSEVRGAAPLPVRAAVAIDGPGDIARFVGFDAEICSAPVIVPQTMFTARVLLPDAARAYRLAAGARGDTVDLVYLDTGHFEPIAPGRPAWTLVEDAIVGYVTAATRRSAAVS